MQNKLETFVKKKKIETFVKIRKLEDQPTDLPIKAPRPELKNEKKTFSIFKNPARA